LESACIAFGAPIFRHVLVCGILRSPLQVCWLIPTALIPDPRPRYGLEWVKIGKLGGCEDKQLKRLWFPGLETGWKVAGNRLATF